jgi:hypothetical protein
MDRAKTFGTCCKELADALSEPPNSFFHTADNGVLYLTVGYVVTKEGPGFFDQAVLFCPFCGRQLQTREEVSRHAAR